MRVVGPLLTFWVLIAGWVVLVWFAISAGHSLHWPQAAGFGVGAALCLFLALLSWARLKAVRRGDLLPRQAPTHRR